MKVTMSNSPLDSGSTPAEELTAGNPYGGGCEREGFGGESRLLSSARKTSSIDRRKFLSLTVSATTLLLVRPSLSWAQSPTTDYLTHLTLQEAAELMRHRKVSPVELTKACLARIEEYDSRINAFITVTSKLALSQAETAEKEIRNGHWRGLLHGIPIALKDNIDTAGIRTTSAKADFIDHIPTHDAEVVRRLKQAGAVLLGKLNIGPVSHWGPVHNPWALDYECGYSSSGPGAAIAADFCFGALGTDLAGSVRLPASACSVVGFKPSYGLVSNRGAVQSPLDHVGPLCKTVLDAAILLQGIAGYDAGWEDSVQMSLPDYATALYKDQSRPRLGIPKTGFFDNLDPDVAKLINDALQTMRTIGTIKNDQVMVPLYWEILAGLSATSLVSSLEKTAKQFQPILGESLADALKKSVGGIVDYENTYHILREARINVPEIFGDEIDLLVLPTWKRLPLRIDERQKILPMTKEQFMQELWNTLPFNVLGLPAISLPCGFTRDGLPVGVQIVGRPFSETYVLAFAHAYEQVTKWHLLKPKL